MQVILLEKVKNLGNLGDVVAVAPGYGRNFLIPQRKAVPATQRNLEDFAARRAELEARQAEILAEAQARAERMEGTTVEVSRQAGEGGRLFGSVGTLDIAEALAAAGHPVDRSAVRLPEGALKSLGERSVEIQLHGDVVVTVTVNVVAA
ncbi:50S ribosomal protein L9 [Thermithiobacillus plumbiphilus]|uniref:Large ribosomal subunit protein bL9 n=1 Tax=Thermithiobacillus plumbiphilus TaxID=1729899 RepID=A0ABU9D4J4_9PROT